MMNQENYKEIARIVKSYCIGSLHNGQKRVAEELADYFELEEYQGDYPSSYFNKKQFLNDCGVRE